ncbi:ubiquitin carboxyl-terminal hydrolase 2-like [Homalodisca vitripennis]|uniref:ubiquitin carboxyl-terminal hydrolase 2-like n=1 Tax=Homalodisca vitripennis TaxID=197043 RepID=UPI001EEC5634|nr:ubiquitin carboxyl-terminal hydrolase 2-like [Homalodisca vitripennis]KAG8276712.1 Ubiquitin carboxyl-terminal hydrolase 2 [Homalodisca vitripennis]
MLIKSYNAEFDEKFTVTSVPMTSSSLSSLHPEVSIKTETGGLLGLNNIGNTCFLNSIIQCLSNTKPLLEYILSEEYVSEIRNSARSMLIKRFAELIKNLWTDRKHAVNTSSLKSAVGYYAPRFNGFNQQDAQEFLRYLLQGLHEEINRAPTVQQKKRDQLQNENLTADEIWQRYLKRDNSKIVDIFGGQLRSDLKCTVCGFASTTYEPFWDLSLSIPQSELKNTPRSRVQLSQCLDHFTKEETLEGNEKPTCARCKSKQTCVKKISIQKFPQILVIHLKRFSGNTRKVDTEVEFPVSGLDLAPYSAEKRQVNSSVYSLYGVVIHFGSCFYGHYTAYCKHPYCAGWHIFNDSQVHSVHPNATTDPYILFYESNSPTC